MEIWYSTMILQLLNSCVNFSWLDVVPAVTMLLQERKRPSILSLVLLTNYLLYLVMFRQWSDSIDHLAITGMTLVGLVPRVSWGRFLRSITVIGPYLFYHHPLLRSISLLIPQILWGVDKLSYSLLFAVNTNMLVIYYMTGSVECLYMFQLISLVMAYMAEDQQMFNAVLFSDASNELGRIVMWVHLYYRSIDKNVIHELYHASYYIHHHLNTNFILINVSGIVYVTILAMRAVQLLYLILNNLVAEPLLRVVLISFTLLLADMTIRSYAYTCMIYLTVRNLYFMIEGY